MTNFVDPYNYPFAQRSDCMNMQQIPNERRSRSVRPSNKIDDILGTKGQIQGYKFVKDEPLNLKNNDIFGTQSNSYYYKTDKPDRQLEVNDIQGARTKIPKLYTNREPSDPLNPVYKLPYYEQLEILPNKFIRNTLDISDLPGAKSRGYRPLIINNGEKVIENVKRLRSPQNIRNSLDIRDITLKRQYEPRNMNPLNPVYLVKDRYNQTIEIGQIDGNQPKKNFFDNNPPKINTSLLTTDIQGAQANTIQHVAIKNEARSSFINPMNCQDIYGAQSDSLKRSIQTNRCTNPLNPSYKWQYENPNNIQQSLQGNMLSKNQKQQTNNIF